jgi:hypothetical protein
MNRRDFLKTALALLPSALAAKLAGGLAALDQEPMESPEAYADDLRTWDSGERATANDCGFALYWIDHNGNRHDLQECWCGSFGPSISSSSAVSSDCSWS